MENLITGACLSIGMVHCPKCDALNYDKRILCATCGSKLKKSMKDAILENPVDGIYRDHFTS